MKKLEEIHMLNHMF